MLSKAFMAKKLYNCNFYNKRSRNYTKYHSGIKNLQQWNHLWINRPLGLNTNFKEKLLIT